MDQLDDKVAVGTETHQGTTDRTIEAVRNDIAVNTPPPAPKEEVTQKVFEVVEVMPSFPGGQAALSQFACQIPCCSSREWYSGSCDDFIRCRA